MKNIFQLTKEIRKIWQPIPVSSIAADLLKAGDDIKTPADRLQWFENILVWAKNGATDAPYARLKFLFHQLEQQPAWRRTLARELQHLLSESSLRKFLLFSGYSDQQGLLQEIGKRIVTRVVPSPPQNDLLELIRDVFRTDDDIEWVHGLPQELLIRFLQLLEKEPDYTYRPAGRAAAVEALQVFGIQLAQLGLTPEVSQRSKCPVPTASPFWQLQGNLIQLHDHPAEFSAPETHRLITLCQQNIALVYDDMEINGASVALVFRLETMTAALNRIRALLDLAQDRIQPRRLQDLIADTVETLVESRSVLDYLNQQMHLVSRKIAERNGQSADHYIARSAGEKRELFVSALKGGAIVLAMTVAKLAVHTLPLPSLVLALATWIIYSAGFLSMQFTHSTLATKLPSYTASLLARLMNKVRSSEDMNDFAREIRRALSSQGLAFLGNIAALVPLAFLFDFIFLTAFGRHFMSVPYSEKTLAALHPVFSFAVPLGALTGVLLWLSSLAGGWLENWVVFRKLPLALAEHRKLNYVFGPERTARLGIWLQEHASGIGANVSLGFLFGFVPLLGSITGLPLDSKHVTISSTSAVLSFLNMPPAADPLRMIFTVCGALILIGIMNLAVSFILALVVAARASAVHPRRFRTLMKLMARRLFSPAQSAR